MPPSDLGRRGMSSVGSLGLASVMLLVGMDSGCPAPLEWATATDLVGCIGRRRRGRLGNAASWLGFGLHTDSDPWNSGMNSDH